MFPKVLNTISREALIHFLLVKKKSNFFWIFFSLFRFTLNNFLGKDASRSFVTGDFQNDLNDEILDLSESQIADIFNWKDFYDKTYDFVGLMIGKFYDERGAKTEYMIKAEKILENHKNVFI
jgi:hypothetical protein